MSYEPDLTREEREHVEKMLLRGEELCWAVRPVPRVRLLTPIHMSIAGLLGTLTIGALEYGLLFTEDAIPLLALLFSPFLLYMLYVASSALRLKMQLRRSVYLLTNVRAIVLTRGLRGGFSEQVYYLTEGMVQRRKVFADGSGHLIFERKILLAPGEIVINKDDSWFFLYEEKGFIELPDVAATEGKMKRLIAALDNKPLS